MKESRQDRYYLEVEGDEFFDRNMKTVDPHRLRPHKARIAEQIADTSLSFGTQQAASSSLDWFIFRGMQQAEDSSPWSVLVSSPNIGISPSV